MIGVRIIGGMIVLLAGIIAGLTYVSWRCGQGAVPLFSPLMVKACVQVRPATGFHALCVSLLGVVGFVVVATGVGLKPNLAEAAQRRADAFGQDAWATRADIKAAGLLGSTTPDRETMIRMVGRLDGLFPSFLTYAGDAHGIVAGPNRSGKGAGVFVPTLLTWRESAVVLDPKGEFCLGDSRFGFPGTSGFRATLGRTIYYCPTDPRSARFNPLRAVRKGMTEVRDMQNLVLALTRTTEDSFWDRSAREYMVGVGLHLLYHGLASEKSICGMRRFLARKDDGATEMLFAKAHPVAAEAASAIFPTGEDGDRQRAQREDIYKTARSYLSLWDDPTVDAVTSGESDFALSDLMCAEKPVTLYISKPPSDAYRLVPIVHLLLSQILRELMEHQDSDSNGRPKRHKLLLLLDEFDGLGRMLDLAIKLPQMPGYGITAFLGVQTLRQLDVYAERNIFVDNSGVVVLFGATAPESTRAISTMVGLATEHHETESRTSSSKGGSSRTVSEREIRRALVDAGEVRSFPADEEMVLVPGYPPIRAKKIRYWQEMGFRDRLLPAAPIGDGRGSYPRCGTVATDDGWT